MLWQRQDRQPDSEPIAKVDLRSLSGLPGRLSFAEGFGGHRMTHLACTVQKVDHSEIVLSLPAGVTAPAPESAVILEVANHLALVQCFTSVLASARGATISLRTPSRPHVVQRRRFPRIDLFLGITLHTPDRPIEAIAGQMINLSIDGAAIVLAEPIQPGTTVTLNLTSLGLYPPETEAIARRLNPTPSQLWVVGLQFRNLTGTQEVYLGKYISQYSEQPV